MVNAIQSWITTNEANDGITTASQLIARARSVQKNFDANAGTTTDKVGANLAGHLAEMIGLLHDCDSLKQSMTTSGGSRNAVSLHGSKHAKGYVYHRDPWMAARATLGAIVGILSGCAFWIWSGWPEGGTAVSIIGVCCTLFGNFDTPVPFVIKYITGLIYGVAISLVYSFIILPQVTDFTVLVAVLAPAFLLAGSLQARPPTTFMALGITLTIPILSGLGTNYTGDFATSINTGIALFTALGFGAVSMSLFQTTPVDASINRLLNLCRRDVGRRARGDAPNEARWTSLMIDRTALLLPRLRMSRKAYANVLDDTLRHLRIGHVVGQLRKAIPQTSSELGFAIDALLSAITANFNDRKPTMPADLIDLDQRIETLMAIIESSPHKNRSRLVDLLIDLRFALGTNGVQRKEYPTHDC